MVQKNTDPCQFWNSYIPFPWFWHFAEIDFPKKYFKNTTCDNSLILQKKLSQLFPDPWQPFFWFSGAQRATIFSYVPNCTKYLSFTSKILIKIFLPVNLKCRNSYKNKRRYNTSYFWQWIILVVIFMDFTHLLHKMKKQHILTFLSVLYISP